MPRTILDITLWKVFVGFMLGIEFFSTLIILFVCHKPKIVKLQTSTKEALILSLMYILIMALLADGLPNWRLPIFWFGLITIFPVATVASLWYKKLSL